MTAFKMPLEMFEQRTLLSCECRPLTNGLCTFTNGLPSRTTASPNAQTQNCCASTIHVLSYFQEATTAIWLQSHLIQSFKYTVLATGIHLHCQRRRHMNKLKFHIDMENEVSFGV